MLGSENIQYLKNLLIKIQFDSNTKLVFSIIFILSSYLFLILNPYNILDYIYLPFVIFIVFGCVYLFFSIDNTFHIDLFMKKLSYYLFIFIICFMLYYLFKYIIVYIINISLGALFLFYVVGFAFIYRLFFEETDTSKANDLFYTIQYLIFYIPCLLIDLINSVVKDGKDTNKTTYILGFLLILLIALFYVIPYIIQYLYKYDGILLIDKKQYLNKPVLTISLKELNDKIESSQSFWNHTFNREYYKSLSDNDIQKTIDNAINSVSTGYDEIDKYVIKQMTREEHVKQLIIQYKDDVDKLKYYINNELKPSFWNKIYYSIALFNNKFFLSGNQLSEEDLLSQYISPQLYTYHYGISFWLYINTHVLSENNREKALILNLDSRPSLYYDYNTRQLVIEIKDYVDKSEFYKQKRIYNSSKILFQKWNHVVMNYANGQFDLFMNNELVSTQSNVSPYINNKDILQVGSSDNTDLGGISHLKYYTQPLTLYRINEIYNSKLISIE